MSDDLDAKAREIAAGLTVAQVRDLRLLVEWDGHPTIGVRVSPVLRRVGLSKRLRSHDELTDLGRAVARVLASQEVDRG